MSALAPSEARRLLDKAAEAAQLAYAPYSGFRVGAVVVAEDGTETTGANVENAAYPATICAEGNAISSAIGGRGARRLTAVAVISPDGDECYPCGNCRQLMREFGVGELVVQGPDGAPRIHPLEDLLPHAFGPEHLP